MQKHSNNNSAHAKLQWQAPNIIEINFKMTQTGASFMDENQNATGVLS